MEKICFIVPYFGKLPNYMQVWLDSCAANPTIEWKLFTDDQTQYDYPKNVSVIYMDFSEMRDLVQKTYDFEISLKTPYKLCDYKIAYGEIFSQYLIGFDFWGFCDIDLIWGDIRRFYTSELLSRYDKIGDQGHATIFRNTQEVNSLYRSDELEDENYKMDITTDDIKCTDVGLIRKLYTKLEKTAFTETIYAGLEKYEPGFYLQAKPKEEAWKNRRQVFLWDNGQLYRYYLDKDGNIATEEYLYIHFFCRPMKNKIKEMDRLLIYPDVYKNCYKEIDSNIIDHYGKKSKLAYYWRVLKQNKHRISFKKVCSYFALKAKYNEKKK